LVLGKKLAKPHFNKTSWAYLDSPVIPAKQKAVSKRIPPRPALPKDEIFSEK
jgi:hypothetical protein